MWNKQQAVIDSGKLWAKYKQILVGIEQQKKIEGTKKLVISCNFRT